MAGGRPTIYTDDLIENAHAYLDEWKKEGDMIPSQSGLAVFLGVSLSCIDKWSRQEEKQEFLRILDKIQVTQQSILINKGLSGDFNSNITKLVLGKHGFHDKLDNTQAGPGGGPIQYEDVSDEALDRKIKQLEQDAADES